MADPVRRCWLKTVVAVISLALPVLGVRLWMAWTFPLYLHGSFAQDLVFAFAWCGLLVWAAQARPLHLGSVPLALFGYLAWLFLVVAEAVSYDLQATSFNNRFFAHLDPHNLGTAVHAFPTMIGGGLTLVVLMALVCFAVLSWMRRVGRASGARLRSGIAITTVAILVPALLGVDSAPRRMIDYVVQARQSAHYADTPQGQAVERLLVLPTVAKADVVATPGKSVVWIYLESLERTYWDPKLFPGLTPNLDRMRTEGLDFSGLETFSGAGFTIAGMFASQCGMPYYSSAFSELDSLTGNSTDAATFHPSLVCFGDVLHRAGYRQVYLGGAPMAFSNKGLFYHLHGYDKSVGLHEFEAEAQGKLPESGWGLYDSVLFPLALDRYKKLESEGRPFNLTMITLDTHPPDGRPSPGCPRYAASPNSMLQAVHCTDHLLGAFVSALKKQPDWKNTVVVIMSDHLMMRNVAQPLYPPDYHRQPSLLVLNAGSGVRPARMYHMDIAPTLLHLMGVHTNATFIAGADRSAPAAAGSKLVNDALTAAVLRKVLWSQDRTFELCRKGTLLSSSPDGDFDVGGRKLLMNYRGDDEVGIRDDQTLDFFIGKSNAKLVMADADMQPKLLGARGNARVLTIQPVVHGDDGNQFSIDWIGARGARAHIADVPRLQGLMLASRGCSQLLAQVDAAPAGKSFDLSAKFKATTLAAAKLSDGFEAASFSAPDISRFELGLGWLPPQPWGSIAIGSQAGLVFKLPDDRCKGALLQLKLDPYLPPSRPRLATQVWVNGKLATTWQFDADGKFSDTNGVRSDDHQEMVVTAPVAGNDACVAHVVFKFVRPGPAPAKIPPGEDPRPLQLRVLRMGLVAPGAAANH